MAKIKISEVESDYIQMRNYERDGYQVLVAEFATGFPDDTSLVLDGENYKTLLSMYENADLAYRIAVNELGKNNNIPSDVTFTVNYNDHTITYDEDCGCCSCG